MPTIPWESRYFSPEPAQREMALALYSHARDLPLICPHGHVDPRLFSDPDYTFGSPVDLLLIPDHYIFRMLYSQGVSLDRLGIPRLDRGPVEQDHRKIWRLFAEHWYLFRGTPTGLWLRDELREVFGIEQPLNPISADAIYDAIVSQLAYSAMKPRALYERFNIEVLATTDAATDTLPHHQAVRIQEWKGRMIPTFRPDAVLNMGAGDWRLQIDLLSEVSGIAITSYETYLQALQQRREFFKSMGATATDHAALTAYTELLSPSELRKIFERSLNTQATENEIRRFNGHMLIEMARMSIEDGLVMQLHVGSMRNHNTQVFNRHGRDMGADIPIASEFTQNLRPLLNQVGRNPKLTLILFNLDESTYSREMAPLAGHYPALKLGPPWWFFDSFNGMRRYFDSVIETAGLYNTAGFNDDTRAFLSIPARHDLWRRASADWLAGLVLRGMIEEDEAYLMMVDMAYGLAKTTYRIGE